MPEPQSVVLIYSTFPSLEEAKTVGHALVAERLAACVNLFPGMVAIFEWEGKTEEGQEVAMLVKTREGLSEAVMAEIKRRHSYSCPALLKIPVSGGSTDFLSWIVAQTSAGLDRA